MTTPAQPAVTSLNDAIVAQKQNCDRSLIQLQQFMHGTIDGWARNFATVDLIRTRRTQQLETMVGLLNSIAGEGFMPMVTLGNEVTDPEIANKIFEANNTLMLIFKPIAEKIKQIEDGLQAEIQAINNPPPAVATAATPVAGTEA